MRGVSVYGCFMFDLTTRGWMKCIKRDESPLTIPTPSSMYERQLETIAFLSCSADK